MAEDFYKRFQLGQNNKGISSIDTTGVSLAAIKALNRKQKSLDVHLKKVKKVSKDQGNKLEMIEKQISVLEDILSDLEQPSQQLVLL